jgi:indolepyruvate ferredoxin oxidoreductase
VPEHIRGYGHVKEAHLHDAMQREAALLARWPAGAVADQARAA